MRILYVYLQVKLQQKRIVVICVYVTTYLRVITQNVSICVAVVTTSTTIWCAFS